MTEPVFPDVVVVFVTPPASQWFAMRHCMLAHCNAVPFVLSSLFHSACVNCGVYSIKLQASLCSLVCILVTRYSGMSGYPVNGWPMC